MIVLLNKWGLDGFLAHCQRVAAFYKEKRDMFEKVAHKYLDGLATWVSPEAGMFVSCRSCVSRYWRSPWRELRQRHHHDRTNRLAQRN